jgi:hypothetical protein
MPREWPPSDPTEGDRAANALAYEEGMASFLGAQFIKSTELICARIISQDQTHDGHRVTAFENWLEKTRDRKGRGISFAGNARRIRAARHAC